MTMTHRDTKGAELTHAELDANFRDLEGRFVADSYTDTGTAGDASKSSLVVTVSPTGNTTRKVFGESIELHYSSNFNIQVGGYISPRKTIVKVSGAGTKDKVVGHEMQSIFQGSGRVFASVGLELLVSQIDAGTIVDGHAMLYVPNMASVPNLGNIEKLAALQVDDPRAFIRTSGQILNGNGDDFSPPYHVGLLAGRYYSAPARSMTTNAMAPNVIYCTFVTVPARSTITKLGFNVTTAAAGNAILGLYKVKNSALTTLVAQTTSIATGTTGAKEGAVVATVDAGTYALVGVFSASPAISWHEISSHAIIGAGSATGFSENAYITPFTFATLPSTANITPTFSANTIEPHFTFRL